jgi:hypothetical protein
MSNSDPTLFERLAKVEPAKLARLLVELAAQDQTILEQVQLLLASILRVEPEEANARLSELTQRWRLWP